jgi:hypothetical protein
VIADGVSRRCIERALDMPVARSARRTSDARCRIERAVADLIAEVTMRRVRRPRRRTYTDNG